MASEQGIVRAIERNMAHMGSFSMWTIGITRDPNRRQEELDFPAFWRRWDAGTEDAARRIEDYLLEKGMKRDTGNERRGRQVYMF